MDSAPSVSPKSPSTTPSESCQNLTQPTDSTDEPIKVMCCTVARRGVALPFTYRKSLCRRCRAAWSRRCRLSKALRMFPRAGERYNRPGTRCEIQKGGNANRLPQGDPYFDAVTRFVERFFRWITQLCWRDPNSLLVATYEDSHGRRGSRCSPMARP
jgi:hypothetical protein